MLIVFVTQPESESVFTRGLQELSPVLVIFHSPEFAHVRIETRDSCQHYVKEIDLTRLAFGLDKGSFLCS